MSKRDKKITVFVLSRNLSEGGAERFASNLVSHIDREKFTPILVLLRDEIKYKIPKDIEVLIISRYSVKDEFGSLVRLCKLIRSRKPDILLSNIAFTNRIAGLAVLLCRSKIPWVAIIGSVPNKSENRWKQLIMRFLYKYTCQIVSVSSGMVNEITTIYPIARNKLKVIYNGASFTNIKTFNPNPNTDAIRLVWMSRLARPKRPEIVLQAYSKICFKNNVELLIYGDGPLLAELKSDIKNLKLQSKVKLMGFIDDPYLALSSADIFVFSSDYEGLGTALVDAHACGLPVVATDCNYGPKEIVVDGTTGWIVAKDDVKDFSIKLDLLINDDNLRQIMSKNAFVQYRKRFSNEAIYGQWEKLFFDVVSN